MRAKVKNTFDSGKNNINKLYANQTKEVLKEIEMWIEEKQPP